MPRYCATCTGNIHYPDCGACKHARSMSETDLIKEAFWRAAEKRGLSDDLKGELWELAEQMYDS